MTSPNEYRRFALECCEKAAQTKDEQLRKLLKDESRLWMEAALETELSWALMDDGDPASCGTSSGTRLQPLAAAPMARTAVPSRVLLGTAVC